MASSKAPHLLALLLLVSLAQSMARLQPSGATDNVDLILSTCNRTLYVDICVSSLRSDPRSHSTDLKGLAKIAVDVSIAYGVETLSQVTNLRRQLAGTEQIYISKCLDECLKEYSDAVVNLRDSIEALGGRSYDMLNSLVSAAMTDSVTCDDGFKEDGHKSPLMQRSEYFVKLCSNALAISHLLLA